MIFILVLSSPQFYMALSCRAVIMSAFRKLGNQTNTYRRRNFPFRKQAMPFGRDVEQFSLLSLSFANEDKNT